MTQSMKHVIALGIKYTSVATVLFSVLTIFYKASLAEILFISLFITLAAYVIGDLFILPRFGNLIATVADFVLALVSVWVLSVIFIQGTLTIFTASIVAAVFISLTEALFHTYMTNRVFNNRESKYSDEKMDLTRMQTEFAEEENIRHLKKPVK
jgi:signal transduction histidine kinase